MASLATSFACGGGDRAGGGRTDRAAPPPADTVPPRAPGQATAQMRAVLDQLAALGGKPIERLSAQEARRQPTAAAAVRALLKTRGEDAAPELVGRVLNRAIPGPGGPIRVRIYTPEGQGPFPVVVYYHGGGWVIGDLDTYDASARALANAAGAVVVSAHYRQGPEHRFPAAHNDAYAAYRWLLANVRSIGGDPSRVAVAGEGAGGNLAVGVSLRARNEKARLPVHQVLVYPVTSGSLAWPSVRENATARPLDRATLSWFFGHYFRTPADSADPRIDLMAVDDLKGLPPTTIVLAEIDPLRSEGEAFAKRLDRAGVNVNRQTYDGVTHGFFGMSAVLDEAKDAATYAADGLRRVFTTDTS